MGRAQVAQEYADADTFPNQKPRTASYAALAWAREGLSRAEWIARCKAEDTAHQAERLDRFGPPLTGEQIRENAYRSWGLICHRTAA